MPSPRFARELFGHQRPGIGFFGDCGTRRNPRIQLWAVPKAPDVAPQKQNNVPTSFVMRLDILEPSRSNLQNNCFCLEMTSKPQWFPVPMRKSLRVVDAGWMREKESEEEKLPCGRDKSGLLSSVNKYPDKVQREYLTNPPLTSTTTAVSGARVG